VRDVSRDSGKGEALAGLEAVDEIEELEGRVLDDCPTRS